MENQYFDRKIKEKLENVTPDFNPGHWDRMQQLLNQESLHPEANEPDPMDQIVAEKLRNLEARYSASTWELMSKRIDEEFHWQQRILRYKFMEMSLMLLALFTLSNISFFQLATPVAPSVKVAGIDKFSQDDLHTTSVVSALTSGAFASAAPATSDKAHAATRRTDEQAVTKQGNVDVSLPVATPIAELSAGAGATDPLPSAPAKAATVELSALLNTPGLLPAMQYPLLKTDRELAIHPWIQEGGSIIPLAALMKQPAQSPWYVSVMTGGDLDYVYASPDAKTEREGYAVLSSGYSGGASIGYQSGKWGLEGGVVYDSKRYVPKPLFVVFGDFEHGYIRERINDVEFNMLKIPLNVKRDLLQRGRWRWYATAGVSLNVALQANYNRKIEFIGLVAPPTNGGGTDPQTTEKPKYTDGLLEGGNFKENHYFTLNIGTGIAFRLNSRYGLFLQPLYQQQLGTNGLGPNNDRFNTLSLYLGGKMLF